MLLLLSLFACADPCFDTSILVTVTEDYAGPALTGVDAELESGTVALDYDAALGHWEYIGDESSELDPLLSANLIFEDSNTPLEAADFEESSGGGGHICESFSYTFTLSE